MDLSEFGTQCPSSNSRQSQDGTPYAHRDLYSPAEPVSRPTQWKIVQAGIYEVCGTTARQLPNGVNFGPSMPGERYAGHTVNEFKKLDNLLLDAQLYTEMILTAGNLERME